MAKVLVKFWLRRFILIFVVACLVLIAVAIMKHGPRGVAFGSILAWSAGTAALASSIAAYWSYRVRCKQVFK